MLVQVSSDKLYKTTIQTVLLNYTKSICTQGIDICPFPQESRLWGGQSSHFRTTKYFYPASRTEKFETRQAAILTIHKAEIKTALYWTVPSLWSALSKLHTSNGWLIALPKIPIPRTELRTPMNSGENPPFYNNPSYLHICLALLLQMFVTTLDRN